LTLLFFKEDFPFLLIGCVVAQEVIDNDQDTVSDSDSSSFASSSFRQTTVLFRKTNIASGEMLSEQPEPGGIVTRDCLCVFSLTSVCLHFPDGRDKYQPRTLGVQRSETAAY
jgi:hypothetical protein